MGLLLMAGLALLVLYVWFSGYWAGAIPFALIAFWLWQMATGDFHDPSYVVGFRFAVCALLGFVPYLVWGRRIY